MAGRRLQPCRFSEFAASALRWSGQLSGLPIWKSEVSPQFSQPQQSTLMTRFIILFCLVMVVRVAGAQSISRKEALRIAESFVQHRWQSSVRNLFHGKDAKGIEVHTPD